MKDVTHAVQTDSLSGHLMPFTRKGQDDRDNADPKAIYKRPSIGRFVAFTKNLNSSNKIADG